MMAAQGQGKQTAPEANQSAPPPNVQPQNGTGPSQGVQMDLKALLEAHILEQPLESAFHGCIRRVLIPEGRGPINLLKTLKSFFITTTPESIPLYIDQFVSFAVSRSNHQHVYSLFQTLQALVGQGYVQPRLVCEILLKYLDIRNPVAWSESLELVRNLVGGVHYKGCRDLMKLLFNVFDCLPQKVPDNQIAAMLKGQELLSYMLNRNSTLLPAYFAHDEICRHYPDKNASPHWILQEVTGELHEQMRAAADMVSGIVQPYLRPVLGVTNVSVSIWRLDSTRHCCAMKGLLPYRECLLVPQEELLYNVVAQQNSKDAVHSVLGLNRQQMQPSPLVEEALVKLGMAAMEIQEKSVLAQELETFEVWSHFASQLVFFHYLQLINITSLLNKLKTKLATSKLRKGRFWLMWSLLHFSCTVQSKSSQPALVFHKEFVPIISLYNLLFRDREPLAVPDAANPSCVYLTAAASIWMVYILKGKADNVELPRPMPHMLNKQIEWLNKRCEDPPPPSSLASDYTIPILLNIFSNSNEISTKLLKIMLEAMLPPQKPSPTSREATPSSSETPPRAGMDVALPIPLRTLNSLAMHAKIRLMEMIKTHLIKVVEAKSSDAQITPALLETYSRLLVWLGTRNFQSHLIPAVFKSQAWGVLHALLEIIVFRVHLQLQYSYRFQLLQQLHTVASVSIIPTQLYGSTENAALRLIKGLSSPEFLIQLGKQFATDPKPLLSTDSEELNRIFVIIVAQSLHISNIDATNWLEPFMRTVLATAPNLWCESTLSFFPPALRQACDTPSQTEQLIAIVEEEVKRFQTLTSEMEQTRLFTETESASLFLCVLWKVTLDTGTVSSVLLKIAQRTQPKKLAAFMRRFVDYVVLSLPPVTSEQSQEKLDLAVKWLTELVWNYNLFPLDRLIMCMILRGFDSEQTIKCLTLIYVLLSKSEQLLTRVDYLVSEVPADYWNQPHWSSNHAAYLEKYPECFQPDEPSASQHNKMSTTMPMYFGNLCLRFLPVFDLLLQRYLELPALAELYLEQLLHRYGSLYKFHDQPVAFVYTTLHYYQKSLADHPHWKKTLVTSVIGTQRDLYPYTWFFTSEFADYLRGEGTQWTPSPSYYTKLVDRLVQGLQPFSLTSSVFVCDWHFSEFTSSLTFALYTCCLELMALPLPCSTVSRQLLQALYDKATNSEEKTILSWLNALGLAFVALPESYGRVLYEAVMEMLSSRAKDDPSPLLDHVHSLVGEDCQIGCLVSLLHSYLMHSNIGILVHLPQWLTGTVRPVITTEWQLLFVLHLLGPILNRLTGEKPKLLLEVVMELYRLVVSVDKHQDGHFVCSDVICDFLYHIKYMHVGGGHESVEQLLGELHPPLKFRLQFLCPDKHSTPSSSSATSRVPTPPLPPTQQNYVPTSST